MYNNKSAKDLLSQFPKRMAEGGEATKEPEAAAVGSTPAEWTAPAIAPNLVGDVASTSFAPVAARTTQLTPISQLSVTPSTLSASQQFARDRAAQQDLLKSVLAQSGAPLSSLEQRALQQKIYAGDINAANLNEQILYPLYEERLRNAYKAVGLGGSVLPDDQFTDPNASPTNTPQSVLDRLLGRKTGSGPSSNVSAVRQSEYDAYLNQLKAGEITGADFEKKFLTDIANYAGADKFDAGRFDSINKARTALGLPLLKKPIDPYANSGFGQFYGSPNFMGGPMYQNQGYSPYANTFNIGSFAKPKTTDTTIKPIDFSKPATTQLFSGGGPVDKIDEQAQDFSNLTEEDRKRLAMILEQRSLQGARMNLGPVSASLVPSSKEQGQYDAEVAANLYGVQPFADVDLKNKKVNQMGVRYGGESPIGNYEIQYAVDPETRQPVISGAVRKQLSPSSSVSAQGTYVPVKDYKDYYNVGVNYVKEFAEGGDVTSYAKDALEYLKSNVAEPASDMAYEGWKQVVPSNVRLAAQVLLGDKTKPFTNADLTEQELAGYADIIREAEQTKKNKLPGYLEENKQLLDSINKELLSRKEEFSKIPNKPELWTDAHRKSLQDEMELKSQKERLVKPMKAAARDLEQIKQGKGNIQYKDYQSYKNPTESPAGIKEEALNLATTLGRFNYEKTPNETIAIKDRWDFNNREDLPFVEKYEKMGSPAKYLEAVKDAYKTGDFLGAVPGHLGMAAILRGGRDVKLNVPAEQTFNIGKTKNMPKK